MFALVDRVPSVAVDKGVEPAGPVLGDIEFRDVWFQYQGRDKVSNPSNAQFLFHGIAVPSCLNLVLVERESVSKHPSDHIRPAEEVW